MGKYGTYVGELAPATTSTLAFFFYAVGVDVVQVSHERTKLRAFTLQVIEALVRLHLEPLREFSPYRLPQASIVTNSRHPYAPLYNCA